MKVFTQLIKEFFIPLIVSSAWVSYNIVKSPDDNWGVAKFVNTFTPTFFLVSWMIGQVFRVQKQVRVERNLSAVEERLEKLVTKFDTRINDTIDHITGGDSFLYLCVTGLNAGENRNRGILAAFHQGKYPSYDVSVRIVDLNEIARQKAAGSLSQATLLGETIDLGNMAPSGVVTLKNWKVSDTDRQSYNIFISARSGSFIQGLQLRRTNGKWLSATRVVDLQEREKVLYEQIDPGFPKDKGGQVSWQ